MPGVRQQRQLSPIFQLVLGTTKPPLLNECHDNCEGMSLTASFIKIKFNQTEKKQFKSKLTDDRQVWRRLSQSTQQIRWRLVTTEIKASSSALLKVKSAIYISQTRDQQRFTNSEVAADWQEPMTQTRDQQRFLYQLGSGSWLADVTEWRVWSKNPTFSGNKAIRTNQVGESI